VEPKKAKKKPNINIDFDGVVHKYISWDGFAPTNPPVAETKKTLEKLSEFFVITIFSVRAETTEGKDGIEKYMKDNDLPFTRVTDKKMAGLIIDDNCVCFTGDWAETLKKVATFQNWQKKKK
jgi:hypothetical protein